MPNRYWGLFCLLLSSTKTVMFGGAKLCYQLVYIGDCTSTISWLRCVCLEVPCCGIVYIHMGNSISMISWLRCVLRSVASCRWACCMSTHVTGPIIMHCMVGVWVFAWSLVLFFFAVLGRLSLVLRLWLGKRPNALLMTMFGTHSPITATQ